MEQERIKKAWKESIICMRQMHTKGDETSTDLIRFCAALRHKLELYDELSPLDEAHKLHAIDRGEIEKPVKRPRLVGVPKEEY